MKRDRLQDLMNAEYQKELLPKEVQIAALEKRLDELEQQITSLQGWRKELARVEFAELFMKMKKLKGLETDRYLSRRGL